MEMTTRKKGEARMGRWEDGRTRKDEGGEGAKGSRKVERTRREVEDEGGKEGREEGAEREDKNSVRRGAGGG
jgi:hypothetical protein